MGKLERRSEAADPFTAMTPRFGRLARAFGDRFFAGFCFEPGDAERLRDLDKRGSVVYVMRYSSRLDYFLFNWLFLREGVRLSSFANGIRFYYYRPLGEALRLLARGLGLRARRGFEGMRRRGIAITGDVVRGGGSAFLFLRTDKIRSRVRARPRAVKTARREVDYLREVVDRAFAEDEPIALVPLALFWRTGPRPRRRFLNVFYGAPERPTDTWKIISFLWNYGNLAVRVGTPIALDRFVDSRRPQGADRVVRQLRRSLLIFLRREEKPIVGPALRPFERIAGVVLEDPAVKRAMAEIDTERRRLSPRAEDRARRYLREIAAHPSPTMLAALDVLVTWVFNRLFARVEVIGFERIVEAAKRGPLVLVPSHRSHFDYLILSWLFYERHLVPPLVAAGINLAFWPLGPIFRRAGGFFLRRSFEGNRLYTAVFRSYVQLLIKDGVTQEFFIEGTRSRTGKTLQPRYGMLGMVLEAFRHGVRRDVLIVPVGFTYERLVEEGSMTEERRGARKRPESLLQLFRARRVLRNRFGAVTVRCGEPVSLAERFADAGGGGDEPLDAGELRALTESLGHDLCHDINDLVTAGRSAVVAAALLGSPARAVRAPELRARIEDVAALVESAGLARSESLERCLAEGRPESAAELLLQSGAVERVERPDGGLVRFSESARDLLAYYRATIAPALAWSAVLALSMRGTRSRDEVLGEASAWLDLLRLEYFPPPEPERVRVLERVLERFAERGWLESAHSEPLALTEAGRARAGFVAAQIRPALECYRALVGAAQRLGGVATRSAVIAAARDELQEQLLLGEARYSESVCETTVGNALDLLVADGIVRAEGNARHADTELAPGPHWERLETVAARLARVLKSR